MITILYEDDNVVVINKPDGLLVHADDATEKETVVTWFLEHVPNARGVGEEGVQKDGIPVDRSGVMHRLDRETSGVMILAKHQEAFLHLKTQFQSRAVFKEYRAFVYGTMKEGWGSIDRPIGRSAQDFRLRSAQRGAKGVLRPSVTGWERIGQNESYAYLKVFPKTGRTHQIRVHLKAINHPIIGDSLYAPGMPSALGFDRLALHAHILELELPSHEVKRFVAPLPHSFIVAADGLSGDHDEET